MALLVAGWFYVHLWSQAGTVLAFNKEAAPGFSLRNHPLNSCFGIGGGDLFTHPLRLSFEGQTVPISHSDLWGNDWGTSSAYRPRSPTTNPPGRRGPIPPRCHGGHSGVVGDESGNDACLPEERQ